MPRFYTYDDIKENLIRRDMEQRAKDNHAHRNALLLHTIRDILTHRNLTLEDFEELVNGFHPTEE
jgi:hypothetical protein